MVGALGIEPGQPVQEAQIELGQVVEQQLLVYVQELLLDGPVKAFAVDVHFWGSREGMPVHYALSLQGMVEVLGELLAVVREHPTYWNGEQRLMELPGHNGLLAGRVLYPQGEAEAAGQIRAGDQMTFQAIQAPLDAVPGNAVAEMLLLIALGLAVARVPLNPALREA